MCPAAHAAGASPPRPAAAAVRPPGRSYWVLVPGTAGELVQGAVAGVDLLVSCPVARYARAAVFPGGDPVPADAWLEPLAGFPKVRAALGRFLARHGVARLSGRLVLESDLPRGKGMGSSSAEILAALAAVAAHLALPAGADELTRAALDVEPTDGVAYPGLAVLDHRRGRVRGTLGAPPPLEALLLDTGGQVDTLAFNRRPDLEEANRRKEPAVRRALALLAEGVACGRPDLIGRAATLSALAHQAVLPKPRLDEVLRAAEAAGAVGVAAAHSGTLLAVLLDPRRLPAGRVRLLLEDRLGARLEAARVVGGGIRRAPTWAEVAR